MKHLSRLIVVLLALCSAAAGSEPIVPDTAADRSVLKFPLIFAARHNYQGLHIYDTFYQFRRGPNENCVSGIYILENPADAPEKHKIRPIIDPTTQPTLGNGNYFDPSLSFDAKKLLFCYKDSPNGNSVIYEIGIDGKGLRQITNLDAQGNPYKGKGAGHHDVRPAYLPDGRIVFTSTRYSGLVPCANNGVAILHVMNADGSDIHTISVNNVTEFDPAVLPDGRILFGRWEYIDRNALVIQSLWSVYPDGTNETAYFANNLVFPEAILQAKPVPGNDNLVVGAFTKHNAPPRGSIAMIDIAAGKQNFVAGKNDINAIFNFEHPDNPTVDTGASCDPWALNENLVIYSGQNKDGANGGKYNSILLIDRSGNKVEICSNSDIDLHNPIPLLPRPVPPVLSDQTDRNQTRGTFFVMDVYQGMPGVEKGAVKWLRVVEETSRVSESPGNNGLNQTFSISAALAWSEKIYHGIVPVEPDGSVYFEAPSGRAIYFQLLDKDYRLVRSMRTFIQAAPGAVRSCTGCHEYGPPKGIPRQPNLAGRKPQTLQPESWGTGYMDYPSMIQPIFDAKCVSCHGGKEGIAAGLDLSASPTEWFNISYLNLTSRREKMYWADQIAGVCCMNGTAYFSCKIFPPYSHGSGAAPLANVVLNDSTHKNLLTEKEKELLFTWIDSNGLYFGTWNYTQSGPFLKPWNTARQKIAKIMQENNCVQCHANDQGVIARFENDWINLDKPEMSRVLRAPLPDSKEAPFGIGACRDKKFDLNFRRLGVLSNGQYAHQVRNLDSFPSQTWTPSAKDGQAYLSWQNADSPVYKQMLNVIQQAREEALANPRIDMPTAYENGLGVIPGRFRQILPTPLPKTAPKVQIELVEKEIPALSWEHGVDMLGLIFEIHRSTAPNFTPNENTRIAETELFKYLDFDAPAGKNYYALVMISDPAQTCGTCKVGACSELVDNSTAPIIPQQKSIEGRCPLSQVKPSKSAPVFFPEITIPPIAQQEKSPIIDMSEVDFSQGFVRLPHDPRLNPKKSMNISFDVKFDKPGHMPVLLDFGAWNGSGWFLQKYCGKWRFYFAGVNCDSSEPIPINQWVHMDIVYNRNKVKIIQDGKIVFENRAIGCPAAWQSDLLIGQYDTGTNAAFDFNGAIKNLKIFSR